MNTTKSTIRRGDIYYVESTIEATGHEQTGNRPAIIVSNDVCNTFSPVLEVVYLTTSNKKKGKGLPTHVPVSSTHRPSTALCEQVHSIDRSRLSKFLSRTDKDTMQKIDNALMISLGLPVAQSENMFAA